jgi:acetyltransferase-like isoleucine patch superfamily enzyme
MCDRGFCDYWSSSKGIGDNAIIRSHTVIYAGNKIGNNFQTGNKANIRELNEIGGDVSIGTLSVIEHHVKIGHGVRIHSQAFVPEYCALEEGCWIGPNVVLTNAKYPKSPNAKAELVGVHIMKRAIIGANSTILPGIKIGSWAFIGAGSVVVNNVPSEAVLVGNPAKIVKSIRDLPYSI